jgi:uncharacterized protein (DUF1697 family)
MKKYLALMRGINVGGKNKVEMKKLKAVFEGLGFANVSTYINSGNVIFESEKNDTDQIIATIKSALKKNFTFDIQVIIRDQRNIKKLAESIPQSWTNDGVQKTDIIFLWADYDNKNSLKLIKQTKDIDNVIYFNGAIIWNIIVANYGRSGMNKFVGTELYKNMTARNVNTVRKLAELMG